MTRPGTFAPLSFLIVMAVAGNCQSADYFFEPKFSTSERYDTNISMRRDPPQDNWITTLSPGVNFGMRHENGQLSSNFTWNQLFYTNQSELNIDEQLFGLDYQHTQERFSWKLNGGYSNRSSLSTEQEETGTGILFRQVMRKQISVTPSVSYALSEQSSLALDYSFEDTTYEKNQNTFFLSDYDYHQFSGTFNHIFTERDKFNLNLSSSRYKTPVQNQTAFNHVAQVGWEHSFNEQLITYVSAGLNYSQTESTVELLIPGFFFGIPVFYDPETRSPFDPKTGRVMREQRYKTIENDSLGYVYRAFIQKTFERGSVSLTGSQNQTPNAQGLQTRTGVSLIGVYAINERWTTGLNGSYSINEITGQQSSRFNRAYYTISPNINWKWTPEINLSLSYTFRQQEFENSSQPSQGNIVQLQFNYQPQINRQVK